MVSSTSSSLLTLLSLVQLVPSAGAQVKTLTLVTFHAHGGLYDLSTAKACAPVENLPALRRWIKRRDEAPPAAARSTHFRSEPIPSEFVRDHREIVRHRKFVEENLGHV